MELQQITDRKPRPQTIVSFGWLVVFLLALSSNLGASEQALRQQLNSQLESLAPGLDVAVAVYAVDRQRFLFTHHENRQLRLASVAKIPVSAAALLELGSDYEFTTRLVDMGNGIRNGSISGLGIIARGDPCLDEHHTEREPDRIFSDWAAALRARGISRISGDITIDASYFYGPIRPATYPGGERNIQAWYSAPASAFAWNNNCIEVQVRPTSVGQPATVATRPRSERITIRNRATTQSENLSAGLIVTRAATSNTLTVSGRYARITSWFPVAIHEDPDLLAGDHLAAIFRDSGITIDGQVRLGRVSADAPLLHEHRSRLLGALTILNQRSQNFYGEQIIRILGQRHRGEGSIVAGTAAVAQILQQRLDLPAEHISLLDGSGLSHDNRSSAWYLCQLLARMARSDVGDTYAATLSLRDASPVIGRVKTGYVAPAHTLAGIIDSPSGRYSFAILINRGSASATDWSQSIRRGQAARERLYAAMVKALQP